jgi:hypothetical protein
VTSPASIFSFSVQQPACSLAHPGRVGLQGSCQEPPGQVNWDLQMLTRGSASFLALLHQVLSLPARRCCLVSSSRDIWPPLLQVCDLYPPSEGPPYGWKPPCRPNCLPFGVSNCSLASQPQVQLSAGPGFSSQVLSGVSPAVS